MFRFIFYCCLGIVFILIGCGTKIRVENGFEIKTERKKRIKVIGIAEEAKGGAIVVTKEDSIYYISNLKDWNKKYINKKVTVTGKLIIVSYNKLDSTRVVQEIKRKKSLKRTIIKIIE